MRTKWNVLMIFTLLAMLVGGNVTLAHATVDITDTITTLASSANPSMVDNSVTFIAAISPVPDGGTVAFKDGGITIAGCEAQPVTSGQSTCATSALTVGSHVITALYSGNASYNASDNTASPLMQQVDCPSVLTVTNGNDSGPGSLRQAITNACAGGTITFDNDYTITLASQLTIDKSLTINGETHSVTVSGNNAVRVFYVNTGGTFNLLNLIVANGNAGADYGGGIYNNNSSKSTLTNVTFRDNSAKNGGGMYNTYSSPTLTNVTFSGNTATHYGGGISNYFGNSVLTNVTFSGNTAGNLGGGMYNNSSSPIVTDVTFSNNQAVYGGGMMNVFSSNPTLTNVTFSGNTATHNGGGMHNEGSNPVLTNVTFSGNTAASGGVMSNFNSSPTLTNVTFSGNAATYGGGMSNIGISKPTLRNSILWGDSGGEIFPTSSVPTVTDSVVQGGYTDEAGNISITNDPLLGTLGNYGGTTETIPLLLGSPAINAGNDSFCLATDQRGVTRPQGSHCDIGAFEFEPPADTTSPVITPAVQGTLGQNDWYTSDVSLIWAVSDAESVITSTSGCDPITITVDQQATDTTCTATSAGGTSNVTVSIKRDATAPVAAVTGVNEGATYILGTVPAAGCSTSDAPAGVAVEASISLTGGNALGVGQFTATCSGAVDNAGNAASPVSVRYNVIFQFTGFTSPVNNSSVMNIAKARQTIPLKFRITDANENPVTNLTSVNVTAVSLSCSVGTTTDLIEEYATGNSGLQNLGNGYYQWNWKTPAAYASSCKTLKLDLGEGIFHTALFQFKK